MGRLLLPAGFVVLTANGLSDASLPGSTAADTDKGQDQDHSRAVFLEDTSTTLLIRHWPITMYFETVTWDLEHPTEDCSFVLLRVCRSTKGTVAFGTALR